MGSDASAFRGQVVDLVASGSAGKTSVRRHAVGFISNTPTPATPLGYAAKDGTLKASLHAAGVTKVNWLPFKNGPDLSAALKGGSLDLGIMGDTPALTAKATGVKTRLVNQGIVGQDAWLFTSHGGLTTLAWNSARTAAIAAATEHPAAYYTFAASASIPASRW